MSKIIAIATLSVIILQCSSPPVKKEHRVIHAGLYSADSNFSSVTYDSVKFIRVIAFNDTIFDRKAWVGSHCVSHFNSKIQQPNYSVINYTSQGKFDHWVILKKRSCWQDLIPYRAIYYVITNEQQMVVSGIQLAETSEYMLMTGHPITQKSNISSDSVVTSMYKSRFFFDSGDSRDIAFTEDSINTWYKITPTEIRKLSSDTSVRLYTDWDTGWMIYKNVQYRLDSLRH